MMGEDNFSDGEKIAFNLVDINESLNRIATVLEKMVK